MPEEMRYFARVDDRPESDTFGNAQSLHRFQVTEETVITERYDPESKEWVDNPNLIAMTGIGGDEDYQEIDEEMANRFIKEGADSDLTVLMKRLVRRGGVGSGHFGHAGRPDEVGGSLPGKGKKHVGLTSARPGRDEPEAVLEDMQDFEVALNDIDGVSKVLVELGEGGWEGGSEPTWVISYDGNGEALTLIARTGKKFNQDGVLIYEACKGAECSPVVTWTFGEKIRLKEKNIIQDRLVDVGIGGWTWYNDGGRDALRAVNVPQWGGDAERHLSAADMITESFSSTAGLDNSRTDFDAKVTIMEREGENSYDNYIENGEDDEQ